jgi:L-fuconolactonase
MARVIDAHQHFWGRPTAATHPWITERDAAIDRAFGPADLRPELAAAGVDATILVQTRHDLAETREFLAIADATDFVAGVVGWVDLISPHVADDIAALRREPGGRRLVGIRHMLQDERDPRWIERPDVAHGLAVLAELGLVYDLLVRPRELPAGLAVARRFPTLRFVLDHIGKPPIASGARDRWATGMAPFAALPNVWCKLSGMVTEADWACWRAEDLAPYVEAALGWFGEERLLFGSDWPVCLLAADYGRVKRTAEALLAPLTPERRAKIFGANAAAVYGLPANR